MMMLFRQPDVTGPCASRGAERPIIRRYGMCVLLCTVLLPGVGQASPNATLQMTAKLTQSTCTVTMDQPNGKYALQDTNAAEIWTSKGYIQSRLTKITLTLSKCGLGDDTKTPAVILTGPKAEAGDLKGANDYTFRDPGGAGGTAKEFFIGVAKRETSLTWGTTDFYKNTDPILFTGTPQPGKGESGEGKTADVWVGVASGTPGTISDKNKARAGTVQATLTFDMVYQ